MTTLHFQCRAHAFITMLSFFQVYELTQVTLINCTEPNVDVELELMSKKLDNRWESAVKELNQPNKTWKSFRTL